MMKSSGERLPKAKRINRILWITSAAGGAIFAISFFWYQTKSGLGEFWGWNPTIEIVFQLVMFLIAWVTQGSLLTLFILMFVKRYRAKPILELTKANKYRSLRKLSLWIAAIPGIVLSPLFVSLVGTTLFKNLGMIFWSFAGFSFIGLAPGAMAMIALLVLAIIKARQKPIDPTSPTPNPQLAQIIIAAITAALPTAAFLIIWLNAFEECQTNCFIFNHPTKVPLAIAYLALWLVQTIIWFRNRNKLTR
jgi:MFS family permease